MLSLSLLAWIALLLAVVSFWWQSDRVKNLALSQVIQLCRRQNLQLLDQTLVLKGVWPLRDESGVLGLRRRYSFEFTSTGETRYQGRVLLLGGRLLRGGVVRPMNVPSPTHAPSMITASSAMKARGPMTDCAAKLRTWHGIDKRR